MARNLEAHTRIRRSSKGWWTMVSSPLLLLSFIHASVHAFHIMSPQSASYTRHTARRLLGLSPARVHTFEPSKPNHLFIGGRRMMALTTTKEEEQEKMIASRRNPFRRIMEVAIMPAFAFLTTAFKPAHAYRDLRMSPETRVVAAILGRFIIPIGLCLYFAVNYKNFARDEAKRVRQALDAEQKKKEAYIEEMKQQGFNLGGVGGSLSKEEEEMLGRVEGGQQLLVSEKAAWVKLLQRAQYSRDVVDGKVEPNADIAIMTKKELKRVVNANKTVKEAGFKPDFS